jgi:hypothetical protein
MPTRQTKELHQLEKEGIPSRLHHVNFSGSGRLCKESHGWWRDHLTLSWGFKTHLMQAMTCDPCDPRSSASIKKKLAHLERTCHDGSSTFCSLQQLQLVTFSCRLLPSFPFDFTPLFSQVVTFFHLRSTPLQSGQICAFRRCDNGSFRIISLHLYAIWLRHSHLQYLPWLKCSCNQQITPAPVGQKSVTTPFITTSQANESGMTS